MISKFESIIDSSKTNKLLVFEERCVASRQLLFALASVRNRYILVTGGAQLLQKTKYFDDVFLFDTEACRKIAQPDIPRLQNARTNHSSCSTQKFAFVFGGASAHGFLNSLEYLDLQEIFDTGSEQNQWKLLQLNVLLPVVSALMVPVSQTELLIIGGNSNRYELGSKSGLILDTAHMSVKRTFDKPFGYKSQANTFCVSKSGTIAAILDTVPGGQHSKQYLVELNDDYESFRVVKDLTKK